MTMVLKFIIAILKMLNVVVMIMDNNGDSDGEGESAAVGQGGGDGSEGASSGIGEGEGRVETLVLPPKDAVVDQSSPLISPSRCSGTRSLRQ